MRDSRRNLLEGSELKLSPATRGHGQAWNWRLTQGHEALLRGGERRYRGWRGCMPAPALRPSAGIEREEDALPPFIAARDVDSAVEDERRIEREPDTGFIPQRLAPEDRAILAAERIDAIRANGDVEDVLGNGY